MARVEIKYESSEVPKKLTEVAKKKGYASREEYLREVLTKIAYEEYESESAMLYRQSLDKVVQGLQGVYDVLLLNAELGLLKLPTEKREKGDMQSGKIET